MQPIPPQESLNLMELIIHNKRNPVKIWNPSFHPNPTIFSRRTNVLHLIIPTWNEIISMRKHHPNPKQLSSMVRIIICPFFNNDELRKFSFVMILHRVCMMVLRLHQCLHFRQPHVHLNRRLHQHRFVRIQHRSWLVQLTHHPQQDWSTKPIRRNRNQPTILIQSPLIVQDNQWKKIWIRIIITIIVNVQIRLLMEILFHYNQWKKMNVWKLSLTERFDVFR